MKIQLDEIKKTEKINEEIYSWKEDLRIYADKSRRIDACLKNSNKEDLDNLKECLKIINE